VCDDLLAGAAAARRAEPGHQSLTGRARAPTRDWYSARTDTGGNQRDVRRTANRSPPADAVWRPRVAASGAGGGRRATGRVHVRLDARRRGALRAPSVEWTLLSEPARCIRRRATARSR